MTAQVKRERREARHQTQEEARRLLNRRIGLYQTAGQVRAHARKLTDITTARLTHAR